MSSAEEWLMACLWGHFQIKPVQKQTRAGQRTRFKAIVVIGDSEGHVGLGIKTSKEVATAIRAAIIIAKLSVLPIRRGYWGTSLGDPHSLAAKESGKCGSVTVRVGLLSLVPIGAIPISDEGEIVDSRSSRNRPCRFSRR
jgi:small subunit ribosomal protein S2e